MRVFLFVVLLCFHTAYAQTDVHRLLLDGNAPQLRQAAKLMVSGQQNNSENAELLAEILWRKYPTATSRDIDALSWACKALAASKSGRYRSLLKEVYQSQAHKKLRKYAKQTLRKNDGYRSR